MAIPRRGSSESPVKNDVYTGMLALTAASMLIGVVLLSLEASEYGWVSEPPSGPPINLPAPVSPRLDAPAGRATAGAGLAPRSLPTDVAAAAGPTAVPPVLAPLTLPVVAVPAPVDPEPQPRRGVPLSPVSVPVPVPLMTPGS